MLVIVFNFTSASRPRPKKRESPGVDQNKRLPDEVEQVELP